MNNLTSGATGNAGSDKELINFSTETSISLENEIQKPTDVKCEEENDETSKTHETENEENETLIYKTVDDYNQIEFQHYENTLGMTVTSGSITIQKDSGNLIGISIGGGAPLCPCLYIVQVFDNTPASKDGTLQAGDELIGINGQSVKGKTKVEVAKMIQAAKEEVHINYNKLHADPKQGKSLDIVLKKVKHRLVENMSTATADALGLSRAILCNDTLVKKLEELHNTELMYKGLVDHSKRVLQAYSDLLHSYKTFGDVFATIGVKEPQPRASEAFRKFGDEHRQLEKDGQKMLQAVKPVLSDMGTYLYKAIPDTKLTIKKYADAKFEYLSYCLKVKEMDDEEHSYAALQEPLYRVDTGNYEYRLVLRCRQEARAKFARLRSDVLVKMELLDNKHAEAVGQHLTRLLNGIQKVHEEMQVVFEGPKLFPVEVDLTQNAFQYKSTTPIAQDTDDEDIIEGEEANESSSSSLIGDLQSTTQMPSTSNPAIVSSDSNSLLDFGPTNSSLILNSPSSSTHLIPDLLGISTDFHITPSTPPNFNTQSNKECMPQNGGFPPVMKQYKESQFPNTIPMNQSQASTCPNGNVTNFTSLSPNSNLTLNSLSPTMNSNSPSGNSIISPYSSSGDTSINSLSPCGATSPNTVTKSNLLSDESTSNTTTQAKATNKHIKIHQDTTENVSNEQHEHLLIPELESFQIDQVEPDYSKMDNVTLLSALSLNSSHTLISGLEN